MRNYNKIKEETESVEEPVANVSEEVPVEEPEKEEANPAKKIETLAYDFIAGKFGSDIDTAKDRISAFGEDAEAVVSVAMRILNGTYYE